MVKIRAAKRDRSRRSPGVTSGRSRDTSATGAARRAARTAPTWKAFTDAVASVLTVLEDGQFLILARKRTNHFVQFAGVGRGRVRAEAVSNTCLEGPARLDPKRIATLRKMGWNDASGPGEKIPACGSPNFFHDWAVKSSSVAAAELAVATLRRAFGVRHASDLEYRAATVAGDEILLPTLGIPRYRSVVKRKSADAEGPSFSRIASREQLAGEVSGALAEANRAAGRATAAWLTGEGLASATERLRTRGGEETIPAPLLDPWRKMLLESATQAVQAADGLFQ